MVPLVNGDAERVRDLRILDPACGRGAFLSGAQSWLLDRFPSADRDEIGRCLCGVDIDRDALERAHRELPGANLVHGDALLGPDMRNGGHPKGLDWRREFPEAAEHGGFDIVIGNPPWRSLAGRFGVEAYSAAEIEYLRNRFGGNSYMPNTFEFFVSHGLELTRPGGYFSFIIPDRLASNSHFAGLRRSLLTQAELLLLVYGIPFPGVTADTMVFVFRKTQPTPDSEVEVRGHGGPSRWCAQSELVADPACVFPRPESPRVESICRKMDSLPGRVLLGEAYSTTSGFGGRSELFTDERVSDSQVPVLRGSSIERYAIRRTYWFDFRPEHLTGRTADPAKLGASPKILIRKTGSRLIAAYDESGTYPEQSLYFLYNNRTNLDCLFILGVLNSRPMGIYYRARCLTNRQTIAHAKKADLDRIPLPVPDMSSPEGKAFHDRMVELAKRMLSLHERQQQSAPDPGIKEEIGLLDREIDSLVCLLYGLDGEGKWLDG